MKILLRALVCAAAAVGGPAAGVEFEPTVQFWRSEGTTTWNHNAKPANPAFGNPTSQLTYSGMKSTVIEAGLTASFPQFFVRGMAGVGSIDGGNLRDEDWLAGQVKISDTNSEIKGDQLWYWTIDGGRVLFWNERVFLAAFIGVGQYYETIDAFGIVDNFTGATVRPTSVKVITNDARWTFARLGVNGKVRPWSPLVLSAEIALVPYADLRSEDSHYLRSDLGPVPNIHMSGTGDGLMWQVEARLNVFADAWLFVAYRNWQFRADGDIRFGSSSQRLPLNNFETTRTGVQAGFSYRF